MAEDVADVPLGSLNDECQQQVNKEFSFLGYTIM
jgi:hypothetical protein